MGEKNHLLHVNEVYSNEERGAPHRVCKVMLMCFRSVSRKGPRSSFRSTLLSIECCVSFVVIISSSSSTCLALSVGRLNKLRVWCIHSFLVVLRMGPFSFDLMKALLWCSA